MHLGIFNLTIKFLPASELAQTALYDFPYLDLLPLDKLINACL